MTRTEARAYVKRCREGLRGFEQALAADDLDALHDWAGEVLGSAAALQQYVDERRDDA